MGKTYNCNSCGRESYDNDWYKNGHHIYGGVCHECRDDNPVKPLPPPMQLRRDSGGEGFFLLAIVLVLALVFARRC